MPAIASTDIKFFLSVNNPETDAAGSGGAIQDDGHASGGISPLFTDISASGTVQVFSSSAGDVRTATVTGRDTTGAIVSQVLQLAGTAVVTSTQAFARINKVILSAKDAVRSVTLRKTSDGVIIISSTNGDGLGPNMIACRRLFYDAVSAASPTTRWELVYVKNINVTDTLLSGTVTLQSDLQSRVKIALEANSGDVTAIANRVATPANIGAVTDDGAAVSIPTNQLGPSARQGVWIQQLLPTDDPAFKSTFQLKVNGAGA